MKFEDALYQQRVAKQLTQQELADALFVTRQTVSRWEKGHNYPTLDMLGDICRVLETDIQSLFPEELTKHVKSTGVPVSFFRKLMTFIIGTACTGGLFIFILLFGKYNDVDIINRYNPFLTSTHH
ncbi:helix-turn-helix transcriptional regulator [Weissella ceti]|uniref:Helix-turn-helix transcriptional regulator n=1 Tax=Weissella ceti TaxID=759620 RepID=A0ABT3E4U9_9LACO|nr:helix-turn-helix transcriptional regulator [Weissella ceti]MCW0953434.1 helix-turn-helix transcriptional regulator [Weissella ceti]QVK12037.1 helix-turn-helix transcriptional regulator [Weissella ceti]